MVMAAPKPCGHHGCGKLTTTGRCDDHPHKSNWEYEGRPNRHQRGYGRDWERKREQALQRDGRICQTHKRAGMYRMGTHVDHIVPKEQGGSDDLDNLQTLCKACHEHKTATERSNGQ